MKVLIKRVSGQVGQTLRQTDRAAAEPFTLDRQALKTAKQPRGLHEIFGRALAAVELNVPGKLTQAPQA